VNTDRGEGLCPFCAEVKGCTGRPPAPTGLGGRRNGSGRPKPVDALAAAALRRVSGRSPGAG
jgi:hypothetical protein